MLLTSYADYSIAVDTLETATDTLSHWTRKIEDPDKLSQIYPSRTLPCDLMDIPRHLLTMSRFPASPLPNISESILTNMKNSNHEEKRNSKSHLKIILLDFSLKQQPHLLTLRKKRLFYTMVLRPIWTYVVLFWGWSIRSNIKILRLIQNKTLRKMTVAPWYFRNDLLHQNLNIDTVSKTIKKLTKNYEYRFHNHPNVDVINLLADSPVRRHKRNWFIPPCLLMLTSFKILDKCIL